MKEEYEIKNAVIKGFHFDLDHGLSAYLSLDYGGSGQGFGGYLLYSEKSWKNSANYCGHFVYKVLTVAGVEDIAQLKGKAIRVAIENGLAVGIGHIIEDKWFFPKKDFADAVPKEGK